MSRPLIGLSGRRKKGGDITGNLEVLNLLDIDLYYADYARAVLEAGGLPVYLPLDIDPADVVGALDGLLLSGGTDIDPDRYGDAASADLLEPEAERDEFELAMLGHASALGLPTLGICRGLQIMNVHAGGTLHQHVPTHSVYDHPTDTEVHEVQIEAGSTLRSLYGESRRVNSLHHQTVDKVGTDLVVTARTDDGTVEGIEHASLPMVAVQWHPEMMKSRATDPVFTWLVDLARS